MSYAYDDRTIFVLGSPRSGTAWLSKLFDSHPDALYRHEPDIAVRNYEIPTICELQQAEQFIPQTQAWLNALAERRCLKAAGPLPMFAKNYRGPVASKLRLGLIALVKAAERTPVVRRFTNSLEISDFADPRSAARRRFVISSVSAMGRAGLLSRAAPESRFILVLRHPWGQIESYLRMPEMAGTERFDELMTVLAGTEQGRRRNLDPAKLAKLPPMAQLAWAWVIHNEIALEQLAGAKHFTAERLFDLTQNPVAAGKRLFDFCGLSWGEQTEKYIAWSTEATGKEGYYNLRRNAADATWGWRRRLTQEQIDSITEVIADSVPGQMFMNDQEPKPVEVANGGAHSLGGES
ncbi:MAG TPA: sulfotransferase [Aliidongia sp.]|uniref:sulfotransferase n=1 Tax=Aliidongia sp. TaxID=1914230 RepID=UPI002DDD76C1|nr:sulfotransferase [Aliidongia sp.]HEV2675058.1 sulfotransferase [Aliidongia sp.]